MTDGIITPKESARFLEAAENLAALGAGEMSQLNVSLPRGALLDAKPGIF